MEYFGRLGLVFRKNKERGASPYQAPVYLKERRCGTVAPWVLDDRICNQSGVVNESRLSTANSGTGSHSKGLVEFWSIASPQVQGATVVDVKASTRDSTTPDDLVDIEYLEYEQHVHARARALETSSKFGLWKTLRFWKRRHGPTVLGAGGVKPFISAAATPLPNHHHHDPFRTPKARTPGRNIGSVHGNSYSRRGCATVGPVYYHESPSSMQRQFSHRRAWRDHEVCNMSPYVALSDRRSRAASPVPLYYV